MSGVTAVEAPRGGFSFELCKRNEALKQAGIQFPTPLKTGTTIAGIVYKDGVVLGADTRATEGSIVADKNCSKIHYIASNIYCCGAGTAADTEFTTMYTASNIELHRLASGKKPKVATALRMLKQYLFRYQGHVGAALVLGGVDNSGAHLFTVHPHGSTDKLPYVSMGSGSLAAMATFEDRFKPNMEREEAMLLVRDAITAGIFNDLGSGSNVDLCVITASKTDYIRPFIVAAEKGTRSGDYCYEKGTTAVLTDKVRKFEVTSETVTASEDTMET